MSDYRC